MADTNNIRTAPIVPYPLLSDWIYTLEAKLDGVLSAYIGSNHMQSTLFNGKIRSLPYALAQYAQSPHQFVDLVQSDLKSMLTAYFKHAEVKVTFQPIPGQEHFAEVYIEIEIGDGDSGKHSQRSIVLAEDSAVRRVTHFTTTGEIRYARNYTPTSYYR